MDAIMNKEGKIMKWYRLYKESENEEVNPVAEEKAMEVLAKMEHGTPTDEEFYKTPCFKFLDVRYVESWVEFDTVEGLWSSKNCDVRLRDVTDELQLTSLSVFHKNDLHMINTPETWVWIFGENATWDDVCEARMHFTGDVPVGYGEEVKNEILQALRGNAITHDCLEAIIRSTKYGRR